MLRQYNNNLQVPKISKCLLDILNSSREQNIVDEIFHQEVVFQLEKQLSDMRHECLRENENIRTECKRDLYSQKIQYEKYLAEIKQCHNEEKDLLEKRIDDLQNNKRKLVDNSFTSDASRELSMLHLIEQLTLMTEKYSDLKIQTHTEIADLITVNHTLTQKVKSLNEQIKKIKFNSDLVDKEHKEEVDRDLVKIKYLEKINEEAEAKLKEFGELRMQVSLLRKDMLKSEKTEIKLREAIRKKKDELEAEKRTNKVSSKVISESSKMIINNKNKLEKEFRAISKDNNNLKEKNNFLKKKVNDLLVSNEITPAYYQTLNHSRRNSSFGLSFNLKYSPGSKWEKEKSIRKSSMGSLTMKGQTYDFGTNGYKTEIVSKELTKEKKKPVTKKSASLFNRSSFIFGDKNRSLSKDHVIGDHTNGS
jgi:hypothetical protein